MVAKRVALRVGKKAAWLAVELVVDWAVHLVVEKAACLAELMVENLAVQSVAQKEKK